MGVYESRRGAGVWEFLAIDTESPYMDERQLLGAGHPRRASIACASGTKERRMATGRTWRK